MPIYEYRRPDGSTFEVLQSFSDDPLTHDPESGVEVQRVLHAPAVHFKGSGFYNTDYGTRRRQRESANGGDSAGGSSEGESKASDGASSSKDGGSSGKDGSKASESAATKSEPAKKGKSEAVAA